MAIIGNPIENYVKNQILIRQNTHGGGINELRPDLDILTTNLPTSWIKLASGVSVKESKLKTLGYNEAEIKILKGKGLAKNHVLFSGLSQYNETETLTQKSDFIGGNGTYIPDKDWGIIPMPGIISAEIKSLNRGSLKKATVKFTAQSRNQLTVLDILYLRLGYTVLLEWGNSFYKTYQSGVTNDPNTPIDERFIIEQMGPTLIESNSKFFADTWKKSPLDPKPKEDEVWDKPNHRQILPEIESLRIKHQGNYDALLGKVSNFNWSFNNDGSYDVELTIISLGDVVESLKSNVTAATETLNYVNNNSLGFANESSTLDQHRKDNIILSLLHVFRLQNLQTQDPTKITVKTKQKDPPVDQPVSNLGNLLQLGAPIITSSDWTVNLSFTIGLWNFTKNDWIPAGGEFIDIYETLNSKTLLRNLPPGATLDPNFIRKGYYWVAYDENGQPAIYTAGSLTLRLASKNPKITITDTKTFTEAQYTQYKINTSVTPQIDFSDPISTFIKGFNDAMSTVPKDKRWSATYKGVTSTINDLFLFFEKPIDENLPNNTENLIQFQDNKVGTFAVNGVPSFTPSSTTSIKNPLTNTGYNIKDAFVLKLDIPQYYMRFGYLLNLVEQKVITRIDQGKSKHDDNQNLFNIDYEKAPMLCLPEQISFDWRKCIVSRDNFNRAWEQNIFPELEIWANDNQTANAMNVYLNFEFIADSLTSNLDEKGNISVYNFIKSLCDGINISLGGVNNLEPIIDENTNILEILDSSPSNNQPKEATDYELKLYGYSNQSLAGKSRDASTFVRKVNLKTAITPEYATMVTVGATAGGYVKGIEATAFARWNDGILDRFKEKLIAADKDIANTNARNENEDTIASFERAMAFSSKCFGIEGNGKLWETFP
jgi:hypothetical protein